MAEADSSILIVDDDSQDLSALESALDSLGCEIHTVSDPHDVLPAVYREQPDVVVLDALLPGLSGFDLCKQIKTDSDLKGIQVLIITGVYLRQQYRQEALQQFKADGFLTKPFRAPELQRLVVQLLSRKTRKPQSSFLSRLGLPVASSQSPKKRGLLGRIFGTAEEAPPSRIAPIARSRGRAQRTESGSPDEPVPKIVPQPEGESEAPPTSGAEVSASAETPAGEPPLEREAGAKTESATPADRAESETAAEPAPGFSPEGAAPSGAEKLPEPTHASAESAIPREPLQDRAPTTGTESEPGHPGEARAPKETGETAAVRDEVPTREPVVRRPEASPSPDEGPETEVSEDRSTGATAEARPPVGEEEVEWTAEKRKPPEVPSEPEVAGELVPEPAAEGADTDTESHPPPVDEDEREARVTPSEAAATVEAEGTPDGEDEAAARPEPETESPIRSGPVAVADADREAPSEARETMQPEAKPDARDEGRTPSEPAAPPTGEASSPGSKPAVALSTPEEPTAATEARPQPQPETATAAEAPPSASVRRPRQRLSDVPIYDEDDFHAELKRELSKCRRVDRPLTLIVIQVGDLSQIVELFGREIREGVLWHIAEQAMASLREVDLVGMISSRDLIALTAFACDKYGGGRVVTRMRRSLEKNPFKVGDELPPIVPELRFGMSSYPDDGEESATLMSKACTDL